MPEIKINGQTISFPDVNQSPNWAPSIIQFARVVEDAFNSVANSYDVPASEQDLSTPFKTLNASVALNDLVFPKATVASCTVYYTINKSITVPSVYSETETGKLDVAINSNNVYELTREGNGEANIDFGVNDSTGQLYIINKKAYTTGDVKIYFRASVIPLT